MDSKYIYHITLCSDWEAQNDSDLYTHSSLESEGFIHMAKESQVAGVLDRYFKEMKNLLCLKIETSKLTSTLVMEQSTDNEYFPHIFGPVNKSAIIRVDKISYINYL